MASYATFQSESEPKDVCAGCERLKQMVRALSALVDMQELPPGFTLENYKRLIKGKNLRLRRPRPVKRTGKRWRKITA